MRAEAATGAAIIAAIFGLLLANVASRALGRPLVWTDELALHLMVMLAFIGASIGIAIRSHMAIGILADRLDARPRLVLDLATDMLVLCFLLVMAALVWRWFDLPGLWRAGSGAALAQQTFNFIYTDPTMTLGLGKVWFWLIMPLTCVTAIIHTLAAIADDLSRLRSLN